MSDHPLTDNGSRTIAQASISCRLDYCNSLLYGISDSLIRLQSVQNAAARLVTGTRRSDHITPVLRQLHWLPVRQLIHFRIDGWVSGHWPAKHLPTSPTTAAWYQTRTVADSALLSSDIRICVTPRTFTRFGDRSSSAAGPQVWNGLAYLRFGLRTWRLAVLNEDLRPICLH